MDSTAPTTSSPVYEAPFPAASNLTVNAMAAASGDTNSSVTSQTFTLNIASGTLVWSDEFSNSTSANVASLRGRLVTDGALRAAMASALVDQQRALDRRLEGLLLQGVEARLCTFLLDAAERWGQPHPDGGSSPPPSPTPRLRSSSAPPARPSRSPWASSSAKGCAPSIAGASSSATAGSARRLGPAAT